MKIIIQNDVKTKLYEALTKAGINEIKGACFAYNSSPNVFEIEEVYISPVQGTFAFSNLIINYKYKKFERDYFKRHNYDYEKHNYIGDWHSHPSFDCIPSQYDIKEVLDELSKSNANFLIQLILKIENGKLIGNCYYYNSKEKTIKCELLL